MMTKSMLTTAATLIAANALLMPAAEARGGFGIGFGAGLIGGAIIAQSYSAHRAEPRYMPEPRRYEERRQSEASAAEAASRKERARKAEAAKAQARAEQVAAKKAGAAKLAAAKAEARSLAAAPPAIVPVAAIAPPAPQAAAALPAAAETRPEAANSFRVTTGGAANLVPRAAVPAQEQPAVAIDAPAAQADATTPPVLTCQKYLRSVSTVIAVPCSE